jgi:N-methylhydantoinase A/oxoprolinase/acetone carboxylase beta subunit
METTVIHGEPSAGTSVAGPAVIELPETTVVVPPGWRAERDASGAVAIEQVA